MKKIRIQITDDIKKTALKANRESLPLAVKQFNSWLLSKKKIATVDPKKILMRVSAYIADNKYIDALGGSKFLSQLQDKKNALSTKKQKPKTSAKGKGSQKKRSEGMDKKR